MLAAIIKDGKVFNLVDVESLENEAWTLVPASPSVRIGDTWDGAKFSRQPVDLAPLKAAKNDEINAARLHANRTTFMHGGKSFACDELSRGDIDGINGYVALVGDLPPGWPGGWKAADNSLFPIPDVPAWGNFYASMVAAGNANFAKAQVLKARLSAATTAEEVEAIQW